MTTEILSQQSIELLSDRPDCYTHLQPSYNRVKERRDSLVSMTIKTLFHLS